MRRYRLLLIVGAAAGVLLVLAITAASAWLNTYVRSDRFRGEMEHRASRTVGGPVQIGSLDFSIFRGVKLHQVSAQLNSVRTGRQGSISAQIEEIACTYSLPQLLRRRLVLTGVILEKPQIVLTREPPATIVPATAPPTASAGSAGRKSSFEFTYQKLEAHDGTLSVRDANGQSLAELQGVEVKASTKGQGPTEGEAHIAHLALPSGLAVSDFSAHFDFQKGSFAVKPFAGQAFKGDVAGDYLLSSAGPSLLDVNAKGLDAEMITAAMNPRGSTRLKGSLGLESKWRGIESGQLAGEGDLQIVDGRLVGFRVLQELSAILHIRELDTGAFRRCVAHFDMEGGKTHFTGLQLDSALFQLTGDGTIGEGGALDANLVLALSRDAFGGIPQAVSGFLVQRQDGSASIAFHVGGTTAHPTTDLAQRLLLAPVPLKGVLNGALDRLFHH